MSELTLIDRDEVVVDADVTDGTVVIGADDLLRATGYELKPEGLCRGEVCIPFPNDGERVELHAVADKLGRALVAADGVAAMAGDQMSRGQRGTLQDLELPDLDGNVVRPEVGRRTILIAWASW